MKRQTDNRVFVMLLLTTICLAIPIGCQRATQSEKKSPTKSGEQEQITKQDDLESNETVTAEKELIKNLLPAAAGIPLEDFKALAAQGGTPKIQSATNQPLSLVLLSLRIEEFDGNQKILRNEFRYLSNVPNPNEFAQGMMASSDSGYASVIQSNSIDAFSCEVKDNDAKGECSFQIKNCIAAKVSFHARKNNGKWRIVSFSLPNHRVKTTLGENVTSEKWTATGLGLFSLIDLELPVIRGIANRFDSPYRTVVNIGKDARTESEDYVAVINGEVISLDLLPIVFSREQDLANKNGMTPDKISCIVRADRKMPTGVLNRVVSKAMEQNIDHFLLQARIDEIDFKAGPKFCEFPIQFGVLVIEARDLDIDFEVLDLDIDFDSDTASSDEMVDEIPMDEDIEEITLPELDFNDIEQSEKKSESSSRPLAKTKQGQENETPVEELDFVEASKSNAEEITLNDHVIPVELDLVIYCGLNGELDRIQVSSGDHDSPSFATVDSFQNWLIGFAERQQGGEWFIQLTPEFDLRYDDFLKIVSACSSYKNTDGESVSLGASLRLVDMEAVHPE